MGFVLGWDWWVGFLGGYGCLVGGDSFVDKVCWSVGFLGG